MREIKFRAFVKEYGDDKLSYMTEPFTLTDLQELNQFNFTNGQYAASDELSFKYDNCILMQFTGLKDKNGKEIYEGDVITRKDSENDFTYEVIYNNGYYALLNRNMLCVIDWINSEIEVIGNIHENPELL